MLSTLLFVMQMFDRVKNRLSNNSSRMKMMSLINQLNNLDPVNAILGSSSSDMFSKQKSASKNGISIILKFLTLFVSLVESLSVFLALMGWGLYLLIALLLLVVIIVIFSLINLVTQSVPTSTTFKYSSGNVTSAISSSKLNWTDAQLAEYGSTLTDYDKNLYRLGILENKSITGVYGGSPLLNIPNASLDTKIKFALGVGSSESGLDFGGVSNILVQSVPNVSEFFGLDANNPYFSFNRELQDSIISQPVVSSIESMYTMPSSSIGDWDYAPYAVELETTALQTKFSGYVDNSTVNNEIMSVAKSWGIKDNLTQFITGCDLFLVRAQYTGFYTSDYKYLLPFYAAIFCASSPNDADRSFFNWSLSLNKIAGQYDFTLYSARASYVGSGSDGYSHLNFNGRSPSPDNLTGVGSTKLLLNGKPLTVPLWRYLWDKYSYRQDFVESWNQELAWANQGTPGSVAALSFGFYYGLHSLIVGNSVEDMLLSKMNITMSNSGSMTTTPGQGQVIINGSESSNTWLNSELPSQPAPIADLIRQLMPTFGTSSFLTDSSNPAKLSGYVDSTWGVPFYGQNSTFNEAYGSLDWYPNDQTFNYSGCMVYANAYVASALTGRLINPAEMDALMLVKGAIVYQGIVVGNMPSVYKLLGLTAVPSYASQNTQWQQINNTLKHGGLAVVETTGASYGARDNTFTSDYSHFITITGLETKNGQNYYYVYSSYQPSYFSQTFSLSELQGDQFGGSAVLLVSK